MADRTQRLLDALPAVDRALASDRAFEQHAADAWADLRRGLGDIKKDPAQLESAALPDGARSIDGLWEFLMRLMASSPKYAKQVLEVIPALLTPSTPSCASSFRRARGKDRLSFWKLGAGPKPAGQADLERAADATLQMLQLGVAVGELLPATEVATAPDFVEVLLSRAQAVGGDLPWMLSEAGIPAGSEPQYSNAAADELAACAAALQTDEPQHSNAAVAEMAAQGSQPSSNASLTSPFAGGPPVASVVQPPPPTSSDMPPVSTTQVPFQPAPRATSSAAELSAAPRAEATAPRAGEAAPPPASNASPSSEEMRRAQSYLQRAAEVDSAHPVVAHFCRVHALEALMQARKAGTATPESNALLLETMTEAEGRKKALDLADAERVVQEFSLQATEEALAEDREGGGGASTALYVASCFLEVMVHFHDGSLPAAFAERAAYLKGRALELKRCQRSGNDAGLPQPPTFPAPPTPKCVLAEARAREEAEQEKRRQEQEAKALALAEARALAEAELKAEALRQAQALAAEQAATQAEAQRRAQEEAQRRQQQAMAAAALAAAAAAPQIGGRVPEAAEWSAARRHAEAKKRCDVAVSALDEPDKAKAREVILQALELLETRC